MAKTHLTLKERLRLEFLLKDGRSFAEIGRDLGKDRSTISREVRNHTVESRRAGYGRRHNDCRNRHHCPAMVLASTDFNQSGITEINRYGVTETNRFQREGNVGHNP